MLKLQLFKFTSLPQRNRANDDLATAASKHISRHAIEHAFFTNIIKNNNINNIKDLEDLYLLIQKQFPSEKLAILQQIHSNICHIIEENEKTSLNFIIKVGDALVTRQESMTLCVITADCVPLLLIDNINKVIGVAHAGWRGAKNGIIEQTINSMKKIGALEYNIEIIMGPSIQQTHYEVGEEFYADFLNASHTNKQFFIKKPENIKSFFFNLPSYVKSRLRNFHIKESNIHDLSIDTYSNTAIASYRRFKNFQKNFQKSQKSDLNSSLASNQFYNQFNNFTLPYNYTNIALLKIQPKAPPIIAAKPFLTVAPLGPKLPKTSSAISLAPASISQGGLVAKEQQSQYQCYSRKALKEKASSSLVEGQEEWLAYTKSLSQLASRKKINKEKFFLGAESIDGEENKAFTLCKKTVEEEHCLPSVLNIKESNNFKKSKNIMSLDSDLNINATSNNNIINTGNNKDRLLYADSCYGAGTSQKLPDIPTLKPISNEPELAKILKKLKTGVIIIENKLDLHGFTLEQAYINIKTFILDNYAQKKRYLLVIVGKGRNNQGLIRANIREWLETDHIITPKILFIREALPAHGGDGSLYIFLRRHK